MKKTILLFLSFFILSQLALGKQWIVFFADLGQVDHPLQNDPSKGGHAFVSFVQEDPIKKQTLVNAWGFNPKNPDDGVGFISYIKGDVKDDLHRQKELGFMIEVTTAEFQACLKTKDHWVNTKYSVTMRNCVDFTRDIVNTLNEMRKTSNNSLKQPIGLYLVPSEYIQKLKTLNQSLEYKGLIGNTTPGKQSFPESDNSLSEGAKLLFKGVKCKLTATEKNFIYTKLGFHLSKDKKSFTDGESEEDAFGAEVLPTDMNKDGVEEIFVSYGNNYTSGMTGSEIVLFIKTNGSYQENLGFPGLIPDALSTSNQGYLDLLIGGPGFEFPIWRWNGNKYSLYRRIKDKDVRAIKTTNIEAISKAYRSTIK